MEFEVIWACDDAGGIGKKGIIPWNVPQDLRKFVKVTTRDDGNNIVIMGRKTWDSIPRMFKPLKNRVNIVITSDPCNVADYEKYSEDIVFIPDFDSALLMANAVLLGEKGAKAFVIGGGSVYQQAIEHEDCVGIHETIIDNTYDCDTFIPTNLFLEDFELVETEELTDEALYMYWRKLGSFEGIEDIDVEEITE